MWKLSMIKYTCDDVTIYIAYHLEDRLEYGSASTPLHLNLQEFCDGLWEEEVFAIVPNS